MPAIKVGRENWRGTSRSAINLSPPIPIITFPAQAGDSETAFIEWELDGTPNEIAAVETGHVGVSTMAREIKS